MTRKNLSIIILLFCIYWVQGITQNLPAQFHFSSDGYRLIRGNTTPKGLYYRDKIDTIYIQFSEADYWTKLTTNYQSETDLPATLTYNGEKYDSVGIRFKGMTSYMMVQGQKKSFNITIDYKYSSNSIDGYTTLNLNNAAEDASFMREFLYNYFQEKNVPCAKTNFVVLYINGECWGLYVNVQQLDKKHAKEWFTDADATRWRAISDSSDAMVMPGNPGSNNGLPGIPPTSGPGPGSNSNPGANQGGGDSGTRFGAGKSTLNYLGDDTTLYQPNYKLKKSYKDNPWNDLVKVCKVLNTTPADNLIDSLGKVFDIDGALWFLAHEILYTDDDGYVNKGGMDYYVYYDVATNRIVPVEFDGNSTFTAKNVTSWGPFFKDTSTNYPLTHILFNIPELRQRYLAHVRTILSESFDEIYADSIIDRYSSLIDKYVSTDTKKLFSYNEFKTETANLKNFIKNRKVYFLSNTEVNKTGAEISSVIFKANDEDFSVPDSSQKVIVTTYVTCPSGVSKVFLYTDHGLAGTFTKVEMFDDGMHNDDDAGDGKYGASIPPHKSGKYVRFYIESIAADSAGTRTYSPAGAEHDVYIYRVKIVDTTSSPVVINELMATNTNTASDENNEYDDWIELYNNSNNAIDLSGYFLTDNDNNLTKWRFPEGTTIDANEYLIVWADEDTLQAGLHANFKLSAKGEEIFLISPDTTIIDNVVFSAQSAEVAYARIPNATGTFSWQNASYKKENIIEIVNSVNETKLKTTNLTVYPNPASSSFTIKTNNSEKTMNLSIYNIYGRIVYKNILNAPTIKINTNTWDNGVYLIKINNSSTRVLVIR